MRDIETIDSEPGLVAELRYAARMRGGPLPSIDVADALLDERSAPTFSDYRKRFFTASVETCQAADKSFPAITPRDLHHTAASLAISAGANVKAVQRMLGHAKASMTLDVYADLFDDDLDSVADSLDAAIKSAADQVSPMMY
jgi:integrase